MLNQIYTLARYVVLEAWRTHFFAVLLILLILSYSLGWFVGHVAIVEKQAIQSSLMAAFLRLSVLYAVSLLVITSMVREFNENAVYLWLAAPLQRSTYILGKLSGFAVVSIIVAVSCGIMLSFYVQTWQIMLWTISLLCELWILTAISVLCVLSFHHTVQAFSTVLGFYLLARSISAMQLMSESPLLQNSTQSTDLFLVGLTQLLAMLLPNLDQFTQSEWLIYQTGTLVHLQFILVQTMIYMTLLISMALFDFYRKNL